MKAIENNLDERIEAIKGNYQFISPYHKNKKMLPFNILYRTFDDEFQVQCSTVEYRGWEREDVCTGYKIESLEEKIKTGFLTKLKN